MTKFELTISTNYVPDWTYVEALRELFQNALDQQTENPANKMLFEYDERQHLVRIANKTSILPVDTLLLGQTSKVNSENQIGQHGEGYKIAFMVLLREGKKIYVHNYGMKQEWEARLVKSRRYGNKLVPTIFVERVPVWNHIPDHDLTIDVQGITPEEWEAIRDKNLHLKRRIKNLNEFAAGDIGRILLDENESGRIYVKGLYVFTDKNLRYGYDFEPAVVKLDRDRKMLNTSDIVWKTSDAWLHMFQYGNGFMHQEIIHMVEDAVLDTSKMPFKSFNNSISDEFAERFLENNEYCYPVCWSTPDETLRKINSLGLKQKSVTYEEYCMVTRSEKITDLLKNAKIDSLQDKFKVLLNEIRERLTEEEIRHFEDLIEQIIN